MYSHINCSYYFDRLKSRFRVECSKYISEPCRNNLGIFYDLFKSRVGRYNAITIILSYYRVIKRTYCNKIESPDCIFR